MCRAEFEYRVKRIFIHKAEAGTRMIGFSIVEDPKNEKVREKSCRIYLLTSKKKLSVLQVRRVYNDGLSVGSLMI